MPSTLTAENVVQEGNSLSLNLIFNYQIREQGSRNISGGRNPDPAVSVLSPEYLINCLVAFQAKVVRYENTVLYFVRCVCKRDINHLTYTANYSHKLTDPAKSITDQFCCIKNEQWQFISEFKNIEYCTFYITVNLNISTWVNPFQRIHNDTELVDFELRGKDGSVSFHKAVAVSFSPVIKTGFTGEWGKEEKYVIDAPPGTTKQTLQHLKDYMYADKIPADGLKELLLLASYFMMPDLELRCVLDMLTNVTSEDAFHLFEFGMKHQMSQLIFEIMHRVENGTLSADAIRKHQKW